MMMTMGEEQILAAKIIVSVLLGGLLVFGLHLYDLLILKPKRLRSKLQKQAIRGPSPSFLLGNIPDMKKIYLKVQAAAAETNPKHDNPSLNHISHAWPSTIFPHLEQWRHEYGPVFMFSIGSIQILWAGDIEMVKDIGLCTSLNLGKPSYITKERGALVGQGIASSSGPLWAHQRKIIAPEFYMDKVKGMMSLMVDCTTSMLRAWEIRIENEGGIADIKIDKDLRTLSGDVISRACFGSNYLEGEEIFLKFRTLQKIMSKKTLGIPKFRFFPSKTDRQICKLEKEINSMIVRVVKQRTETTHEKDLLQMILEGARNTGDLSDISPDKFIVDNCKTIYVGGYGTVAVTASWSLMLLAAYPEWQARARAEVLEMCKGGLPDADTIRNMKTLAMVIQETLRLYPPVPAVTREAVQDIKFKDILIPEGIDIWIPTAMLQQHPDLWGPDAHEFNPERFSHGIRGACKIPQAFIPFGFGARVCVGQHLAMTELKVMLCLILSKFCFSLSSTYRHSPVDRLLIEPEHGVRLHMRRV
ncbi:hypothetical protein I3843_13G021300 [Carya illinoinensis]|uniref:Cytochrome P450 n=1 Tax=Carya illinoinensis TaxID=32201 RepID=A0A922ALC5_CARIL|nr:hypothetical protein I3760_13G021700 [Carya illinoinensis]KAG6680088.1 hypothetical protein I3842_13G023100 [Carya illinoinensis]KAG7948702.1 hypothetical protein I3843_13G021300 [Carya illinoinensis]